MIVCLTTGYLETSKDSLPLSCYYQMYHFDNHKKVDYQHFQPPDFNKFKNPDKDHTNQSMKLALNLASQN